MLLTKSQKFFYACLGFLGGVILGEYFLWPSWLNYWLVGFFVLFLLMIMKKIEFKFFWFSLFFVWLILFGIFWRNVFNLNLSSDNIAYYNQTKQEFVGIISAEPDVRLDKQKLTVSPVDYHGKVLLTTSLYPEFKYGERIKVNCFLQEPEPIEDFLYDKYLAKSGIYSVCYRPYISVLEEDQGNYFIALVLKIKKSLETKINQTMSEPEAALMSGILVGSRQGIPTHLLEKFNVTGITHIIAISGFNITIIVLILLNLGKYLYINRKKMIWLISVGLIFFVVLTGMSPSVVRAGIMGFLVVLASQVGRPSQVKNVLALSAVIMILFNPLILLWDSGFQLSFLATIGLIYLTPIILPFFKWLPEKFGLQENLISTFSAIIMTLPLILFQFGRLSLVAPIVNLLVLPIIPIAMLVGFFQVVASFMFIYLGQIFGWFGWLCLAYVVKIVEIFSMFKFSAINITINFYVMLLLYVGLFWIMLKKEKS